MPVECASLYIWEGVEGEDGEVQTPQQVGLEA